jgi:hypothetical protein
MIALQLRIANRDTMPWAIRNDRRHSLNAIDYGQASLVDSV